MTVTLVTIRVLASVLVLAGDMLSARLPPIGHMKQQADEQPGAKQHRRLSLRRDWVAGAAPELPILGRSMTRPELKEAKCMPRHAYSTI